MATDATFITHIDADGRPLCRLRLHRAYPTVVKAAPYRGNGHWGTIEDFHPDDVDHDDRLGPSWEPTTPKTPAHGQRVSYLRVSTADQNLARQREAIGPVDREFIDKISGSSRANRAGLESAVAYLREGDTLVVASIDRLARSVIDLHRIIEEVTEKGAGVELVKESLRFSAGRTDPRDELMLNVMGAIAAFERSMIRERQREGIELAKARGVYRGSPRAMTDAQVDEARRRIAAGETKASVARSMNVGRATLYRYLNATPIEA